MRAPISPRMLQDGLQDGAILPKLAQDGIQNASKKPHDGPGMSPSGHGTSRGGPQDAKTLPAPEEN
eukprot:1600465-Pyramimonas_sp.AAC.2